MANFLPFAIVFLTLSLGATGSEIHRTSDNSSLYRLPRTVLPISYDLLLLTNVTRGDFAYSGEVVIRLCATERTRRVTLHAEKLKIRGEESSMRRESTVDGTLEDYVPISEQSYDAETQFYHIGFAADLTPGKYLLTLHFVGEVLDDVFGFYRSSYRVNNEISTRPDYYITRFSRTPRMSAYLLGWAVHNFHRVNSSDPRVWLWTRHDETGDTGPHGASWPALLEGPAVYSALEAWTALANPLPKLEHFAVPDFNFRAMENWGFVTFRESVPLARYESTSAQAILDNLLTMGHEYAHTWFGNLVTPTFWDYAWLKEGFATYFGHLAVATARSEPIIMEDVFTLENLQSGLLDDSVEHNRTMNGRNVGSPKSCRAAQDFVTYKKGASIIRMFADVVGEKVFKDAMRSYLKDKQYEEAVPSDVYEHLESALKASQQSLDMPVSIGEFVESWANQPNYPLVRVSRTGPGQLRLSQEPFQFHRAKSNGTDPRFWWIPLKIATGSRNADLVETCGGWLGAELTRKMKLPDESEVFLLNSRQIGYYRVDYDAGNWAALRRLLNSEDFRRLRAVDRAGLLDDAFNLARAGYEDYALALELARYLSREDEYAPWVAASRAIRLLDDKLRDRPNVRAAFRRYAIDLITPVYKQLSFEELPSDSRMKRMHRSLVLSTTCSLNLGDCVSNAKSIFDNWIADENKPVAADLKVFVYRVGVLNGSSDDWIALWQRFLKTDFHSEKEPMMNALASTENPSFVNKILEFSVHPDSDIAKQYRLSIIQSIVAGSSRNIDTTLSYIEANLNKIIELRGDTFLGEIFSAIGKQTTSVAQERKLTQFMTENANLLGNTLEAGKKAITSARDNIAWIDICASQIANHLR